jgi:Methane oxygenase PmoA
MGASLRFLARALPVAAGLLFVSLAASDSPGTQVKRTHDFVDFLARGQLVGRYQIESPKPGGTLAKPYLWPLYGPGGSALTRAWPMEKAQAGGSFDHPHQKSAWFCHGDVIPEGVPLKHKEHGVEGVDFWSETPASGRIVCTRVTPDVQQDHPGIITHNEWRTADGLKVLDETRGIHLYTFGDTRLFVFDIDLYASVAPLTFGDTKEGSFGIRINDRLREEHGTGKLENADGKIGEAQCWGRRSAWCDYSGTIEGHRIGLAILDDPANPYPACWHSRGYGLMAANPFGRAKSGFPDMKGRTDLVHLPRDEHLKLRYGLLLHPGDAREGKLAEYFQRFANFAK